MCWEAAILFVERSGPTMQRTGFFKISTAGASGKDMQIYIAMKKNRPRGSKEALSSRSLNKIINGRDGCLKNRS